MKCTRSTLLSLAGLALTALPTSAQLDAQLEAQASIVERGRALLEGILGDRLPGATAALVLPYGETLAFAVGRRSADGERELEPGDRLLSGSIGKTYVAAAAQSIMQLLAMILTFLGQGGDE